MIRKNIKTGAPMPKKDSDIANNPMKLYSYLLCIAGLADYPENTRMFRQKNLILKNIKSATGITDKTVKKYFYELEKAGLIRFKGKNKFDTIDKNDFKHISDYSAAVAKHAAEVWKVRNKEEKDAVYLIPRPTPYTPVPEVTLEKLNKDFQVSELEMKIYLLCCSYRDTCVYKGLSYKAITFEQIRDAFNLNSELKTNKNIKRALYLFKGIGLIDFEEGSYDNLKGAKIPCFKLLEVGYYINYDIKDLKKRDIVDEDIFNDIINRIQTVEAKKEE